ncbi:MAG TPA: ribosome biogenesis GTP-binding protein YihA/YsxC, partial [Tetragenococcus sp.]|nr:ribosome biogenesis GTP-binding protein YihA/YsxC [Tetragenococcus sp.]
TLNFYLIENKFHFVDLPGYGYAKVSKKERAKWGQMIDEYLSQRKQLRAAISLVDMRHDPSKEDIQMYDFFKYYGFPVIMVATKADKVKPAKKNQQINRIKQCLNFDDADDFVAFSAVTKEGKEEAWRVIEQFVK